MNPAYTYLYKGLVDSQVPNPFYGAFPTTLAQAGATQVDSTYLANASGKNLPIMPGSLGTSQQVSLSQLLRPFPQYGDMNVYGWQGQSVHYYSTALSVTRPMAHGIAFLGTYNYSIQNIDGFYDDIATYNRNWQMFDRGLPRHNLRFSGTYQLPFGKGKQFLGNAPRWLDEVVGGWATSNIFYWTSGTLLDFSGHMHGGVVCDPTQNIPSGIGSMPIASSRRPGIPRPIRRATTRACAGRTSGDLDTTAVKSFKVTERVNMELRLEMYNMPNIFIPAIPISAPPRVHQWQEHRGSSRFERRELRTRTARLVALALLTQVVAT